MVQGSVPFVLEVYSSLYYEPAVDLFPSILWKRSKPTLLANQDGLAQSNPAA